MWAGGLGMGPGRARLGDPWPILPPNSRSESRNDRPSARFPHRFRRPLTIVPQEELPRCVGDLGHSAPSGSLVGAMGLRPKILEPEAANGARSEPNVGLGRWSNAREGSLVLGRGPSSPPLQRCHRADLVF